MRVLFLALLVGATLAATLAACSDFDPKAGPLNPMATRAACVPTADGSPNAAGPYDAGGCAADAGVAPYTGY